MLDGRRVQAKERETLWEMSVLAQPPQTFEAPACGAEDLTSIYFAGPPHRGNPTRVFAYYSLPDGANAENRAPGVVCVHGGGGTAFAEWVRIWNRRGFAAIAIDTNGAAPVSPTENPDNHRHAWAGPRRYGFDQADQPLRDHWNYHAVAAVILANSLLRSIDGVDAENVGVTGISWGGYKTCIAVGVDSRFRFAIPVYGCGFLNDSPTMSVGIEQYGTDRWMELWDPSTYLPRATLPMLWVNGTNDPHYAMPLFQKSASAASGLSTLVIRKEMPHGHGDGWSPEEIYAFADAVVGRGLPLVEVQAPRQHKGMLKVNFDDSSRPRVDKAFLYFTSDSHAWQDRQWRKTSTDVDAAAGTASATRPETAKAYFFNLIDDRGLIVSSSFAELVDPTQ